MVTILYYELVELTNWNYYHQDVMAVLPFSTTMAMSGTALTLSKYRPSGRLICLNILVSVIGQAVIQILFQIVPFVLFSESPNMGFCPNWNEETEACDKTTILYLIGIYQFAFVALAFLVGRPFRQSFYTNCWFTGYFIFYFIFNLEMNFNFLGFDWIYNGHWLDAESVLPEGWALYIFYIAMANSVVTLFWERVVVKYISIWARTKAEDDKGITDAGKKRRKSSVNAKKIEPKAKEANISMIQMPL